MDVYLNFSGLVDSPHTLPFHFHTMERSGRERKDVSSLLHIEGWKFLNEPKHSQETLQTLTGCIFSRLLYHYINEMCLAVLVCSGMVS